MASSTLFKGLLLFLAVQFMLSGCAVKDLQDMEIVLISKSSESYFWQTVYAGAESAASEYSVNVSFFAPETEDDYESQIAMIYQAVEEGKDAIVLSACDYNKTIAAVEDALDQGVKVITIDSGVGTLRDIPFIGTDNVEAGRQVGELAIQFLEGSGYIGMIGFEEYSANGAQRNEGFLETISKHPNVEIADFRYVESNRESPYYNTASMLMNHPEIELIATFNEWTTLGVGDYIAEKGLGGDLFIIGFDNNVESVQLLEAEVIDCLVVQNPFAMGYLGVEYAIQAIRDGKLTSDVVDTGVVLITKDNMYNVENQKLLFPFSQ